MAVTARGTYSGLEHPEFMHWSEKPISWSLADHPKLIPSPGSYALVLDATFATERRTARFSRVLIDGGNSINILYRDTMEDSPAGLELLRLDV